MLKEQLMQLYSFKVIKESVGVTLVITRLSDSVTKSFYEAKASELGMTQFAMSLTDVQCDDMFPKKKKPK